MNSGIITFVLLTLLQRVRVAEKHRIQRVNITVGVILLLSSVLQLHKDVQPPVTLTVDHFDPGIQNSTTLGNVKLTVMELGDWIANTSKVVWNSSAAMVMLGKIKVIVRLL
jgi:hypothetical protein